MDTRRRSNNRDRPGASPSTDPQPADDDTGSETRVVRLSDGKPVERRTGGVPPTFLVGIVAVAILGFALGSNFQHLTFDPSPAPTSAALASQLPTGSATSTVIPTTSRPTPTRTVTPVIPNPTNAYSWTWIRMDIPGNSHEFAPDDMWGVADHVLLLGRSYDGFDSSRYRMASLSTGFGWDSYAVPPAIAQLDGASVIDDHIWFMGQVTGVNPDATSWQVVGTQTGEQWESLGPTDAFAQFSGPDAGNGSGFGFVGRLGETWVVNVYQNQGPGLLYWSNDARHWTLAQVPEFDGQVELMAWGTIRDRMVVLGWNFVDQERLTYFVLTSADGATWEVAPIDLAPDLRIDGLTCSIDACIVAEDAVDGTDRTKHLWITTDGKSWTRVAVDLPVIDPDESVRLIRATDNGFLAMAGYADIAMLSSDGIQWRLVAKVKPAIATETLDNLAVARDLVVGFASSGSSDRPDALWRGSLAAMAAAP